MNTQHEVEMDGAGRHEATSLINIQRAESEERQKEAERQTDRQTEKQTGRRKESHRMRQTNRHRDTGSKQAASGEVT